MSRIILSGVNLVEMGPLTVFQQALASLTKCYGTKHEIVAIVHERRLFDIPGVKYIEYPKVKSAWWRRLKFEYVELSKLSDELRPDIWLSMHDITPNVTACVRAVYCHNPALFYTAHWRKALFDWKFAAFGYFYGFLYRINIRKNDFVIVQQDWIRKEFVKRYAPAQIVVALPEVTTSEVRQRSKREVAGPFCFFYPAYPRVFKNFEVVLEAAASLEAAGTTGFQVWLTFDATTNRYARHLMQRYQFLKSVKWLGLSNHSEVLKRYARADCLLFPSKLETWGLPISEFKGTGRPILAADLPYAHETVGDYEAVTFFNPDSHGDLSSLMKSAIENTAKYEGSKANHIDEPFAKTWEELWELLISALQPQM